MSKYIVTLILSVTLFFSLSSGVMAENLIKVMSWNIGAFDSNSNILTEQARITRMQNLADVLKDQQPDVVMFQEFNINFNAPSDVSNGSYKGDLYYLQNFLTGINYPMYESHVKYGPKSRGSSHLVILSKYPLDSSSLKFSYIRPDGSGGRVTQSIVSTNTPVGDLRLSNIHTHIQHQTQDFIDFITYYKDFDPANQVLGGDNNKSILSDDFPNWVRDSINPKCTSTPCVMGETIESIFTFANSNYYIKTRYSIGNPMGISDQHIALVAQVGTIKAVSTPTPTPSLKGDVNKDRIVNISDALALLKYLFN